MARTPNFDLSKQPQWVQTRIANCEHLIDDLTDKVAELESVVETLEGMFERAAIQEFDGIPVVSVLDAL